MDTMKARRRRSEALALIEGLAEETIGCRDNKEAWAYISAALATRNVPKWERSEATRLVWARWRHLRCR